MTSFDLAVIGSGPGGYRAAVLAALRGLKVALVEKAEWGGTCLNRGCVPKKAWYHSACILADAAAFPERGIRGVLQPDFAQAWRHQRAVVDAVRAAYADYLSRLGVTAVSGHARFSGPRSIAVDGRPVAARHVIVATGSRPRLPEPLQKSPGRILTTDDLFDRPPPPGRRVAVLGSGPVGTELAFILHALGLDVSWITSREPLSDSMFSVPALAALREAAARAGVTAQRRGRVTAARLAGDGVDLEFGDGSLLAVDWVIAGSGRRPCSDGLALELAGVSVDPDGFIVVDGHGRAAAGVHAIGDVANAGMSANHALADAAVAVADIIDPGSRCRRDDRVPQALYSALELARIGLGEEQAEAAGAEAATGFAAFDFNPAALAAGERGGFLRLVSDLDSGELLGAEIAGRGAAELIGLLGVEFGAPQALSRLAGAAYNHPARAEEVLNAVETLAARWGMADRVFPPRSTRDPPE